MSIVVKNLNYTIKDIRPEKNILNNISLNIEDGEIVAIVGRTGSGKSTFVHQICGLMNPTSGSIIIDGIDVNKSTLPQIRRLVGIVFQFPEHQLFEETVYKDIAFGLKNLGYQDEQIKEKITEVVSILDLDEEILEKSPFELSDGDKRKVAIAGVLVMDQKILIFDEPAAGLDIQSRKKFFELIMKLRDEYGKTIIIISHNIEDVLVITNRLIIMDYGKIVIDGNIQDIVSTNEDIERYGLQVPQIKLLMSRLKSLFPDIRDNIFTVRDAKIELLKFLKNTIE